MADEWVGVVNTIAPKYIKGETDLTLRNRLWLKLLEKRGRVTFGHSGPKVFWNVYYDEPPVESYPDGGVIDFTRHDLNKMAELDWRGYKATDLMTEKERDMYGDDVGIVNRYTKILPRLLDAVRNRLGTELYIDGNAAGYENRMHGIGSFTGKGTVAAGDIIAQPSDTYAGLDTSLGQYGSWTTALTTKPNSTVATDWPEGSGNAGYDYWSPILVNTSSSGWGALNVANSASTAWVDTCQLVLRRVVQWLTLNAGMERSSLYCMMAGAMFSQFKDYASRKGLILYPLKEAEELGFPETINFEGMGLKAEFGIPAGTFNAMNFDKMELQSLKSQLIASRGPDWDPRSASYLFQVGLFANMKWESPKFFAHGEAYA